MAHGGVVDFGPHPPTVTGLPSLPPVRPGLTSPYPGWLQDSTGKMFQLASRATLNATAVSAEERQATVAAENSPMPIIYGRDIAGAKIATAVVHNSNLVLLCVWCQGEIDSVETVRMNDAALPASVTATHYTGTSGQTADATLIAAFAAQTPPITYADALPGICYSVFVVPPGVAEGFPLFTAIIKGRKVYDPRTTLTVWSDNPALALADFIVNTTYGWGKTVDYSTVITVANECDAIVEEPGSSPKRRVFGLTVGAVQPILSWLETLRTYASCWIVPEGNTMRLVADRPSAYVADFLHGSGQIVELTDLTKRGTMNVPTVMEVVYTDTRTYPWKDASAIVYADGVLTGTTPRRESVVALPGIQLHSQAMREATERLNKLSLSDLSCNLTVFDDGLKHQVGDVIRVSHPLGLDLKQMRILGASSPSAGRWQFQLLEYDQSVYSGMIQGAPTYADTTLPNPADPPAITGLVVAEEVYQQQNGTWSSRIRATWTAATYAYLTGYRAEVWADGVLIDSTTISSAVYASPAIAEGTYYTVRVQALTSIAAGAFTEANITSLGKQLAPSNVTNFIGFEAGGTIYLNWDAPIDIDIWRTELRWGTTSDTWDSATMLDRVDALRYQTKGVIPVGTWKLFAKALDSVGLYSATAASVTVTVSLDSAAFLADTADYSAPTLSNMAAYTLDPADTTKRWVTEDGVAFGARFTAALGTYTAVLASYASTLASSWTSESYDFGQSLSGTWRAMVTAAALAGTIVTQMELSPDNSAWTPYTSLTANATARYARIKATAAIGSVLHMSAPTEQVRIDVIPREETGSNTSLATGAKTITLANAYTATKTITITPTGTAARIGVVDNIVMAATSTFDVYVFDAAGAQVANGFQWTFKGV